MKIVNKNLPIDEEIEINKIVIKDSFYKKGGRVFIVKDNTELEIIEGQSRKCGHWIFNPKDAIEMMHTKPKCSVCGYESADGLHYCSNCGSRMINEVEEPVLTIDEQTIVKS